MTTLSPDLGRRRLLKGGVAAVAAGAAGLAPALPRPAAAQAAALPDAAAAVPSGPVAGSSARGAKAMNLRIQAAQWEFNLKYPQQQNNGDEKTVPGFAGNFSKGLPHNALGEVDPAAYQQLLRAVQSGKPADFEAIPMGGQARLVNPQAGLAYLLQGADPSALAQPPAAPLRSADEAAEILENYWMALLRDVPLEDYGSHPLAQAAMAELTALPRFTGPRVGGAVTAATLFRGAFPGSEKGPYLSQFMLLDTPFGAEVVDRKMRTRVAGVDYLTDFGHWLQLQNGGPAPFDAGFEPTKRYIVTGRDLAEWVHIDVLFQAYFNAMLILFNLGAPLDAGNPYLSSVNQIGFGVLGSPYLASVLCGVAKAALQTVWYQKWMVHRRLRPEEMGGRLHLQKTGQKGYGLHADALNSAALAQTFSQQGSYLLPMAFPEGCPLHPAYGAGHATVAGACVTILKAFFDESWQLPGAVVSAPDGQSLLPWSGPALTVGGELNKLAANVAFGRNIAGVHWRADGDQSLRLGEEVALRFLREEKMTYNEPMKGFSLTRFDGTTITV